MSCISDVLAITMQDIQSLDPDRPCLKIVEQKTGKRRSILLNTEALSVIRRRQESHPNDQWLFQSTSGKIQRNSPKAISRRSVGRVLETIGGQITPKVHLGTHSGRKTRGYTLFAEKNYPIEKIARILNHHSTAVTMAYIGITQADIDESYTELVL